MQFVLRRTGTLTQELCSTTTPHRALRLSYRRGHLGASFLGLEVRKRNIFRTDIWLVDPEAGPIAVALRQRWPRGIRYLVEWNGGSLLLVGGRTHYRWEMFQGEEVSGEVCMRPASTTEALVSAPTGTPEEVLCFVVAVTEIASNHPTLRLLDKILQARPIS